MKPKIHVEIDLVRFVVKKREIYKAALSEIPASESKQYLMNRLILELVQVSEWEALGLESSLTGIDDIKNMMVRDLVSNILIHFVTKHDCQLVIVHQN